MILNEEDDNVTDIINKINIKRKFYWNHFLEEYFKVFFKVFSLQLLECILFFMMRTEK